jgi:hypothetical protein|tara:strand:- start:3435 stop:3620 length:186 start_codon:yes stop_codon:yes gene_type:complete
MLEVKLEDITLEDLLFLLGGLVFQGGSKDDIEDELLEKLHELTCNELDIRMTGIPVGAVVH